MSPPENIQGILISRDPTSAFIEPYRTQKKNKGLCQFNAPPKWLYSRILSYMKYSSNSPEAEKLCNFLNLNCYWTHFHKCPTIKGDKSLQFSYTHGEACADAWLDNEYSTYNLNGKILILLGQDLRKYYQARKDNLQIFKNNSVICFPHQSSANVGNGWSWNPKMPEDNKNKKAVKNAINELLVHLR
jgi:hypothetical protein